MAMSESLYHSLYFCEYLNSYDKLRHKTNKPWSLNYYLAMPNPMTCRLWRVRRGKSSPKFPWYFKACLHTGHRIVRTKFNQPHSFALIAGLCWDISKENSFLEKKQSLANDHFKIVSIKLPYPIWPYHTYWWWDCLSTWGNLLFIYF